VFILVVVGFFVSTIANWLAGKTRPLLCVEWDIKLYTHTHSAL